MRDEAEIRDLLRSKHFTRNQLQLQGRTLDAADYTSDIALLEWVLGQTDDPTTPGED